MTSKIRLLGLVILSIIWLFAFVSCGLLPQKVDIRFSEPADENNVARIVNSRAQPMRVAVAAVISPRATWKLYQDLLDYLSYKLDKPLQLVQGKTYAEINDLIRAGDITLAFVCTNPYLEGKESFGMEALVVPEVRGATFYYSYLIVNSNSTLNSLGELRGRTFAFSDPMSNSGMLAPVYQLALMGVTPDSFFRKFIFTYAHDNSIKAVADNLVDGAAVDSLVYDYLAETNSSMIPKTRVIAKWGPFGINPVVVNPWLSNELKEQLREVFLSMEEDEEGRGILSELMIDRFVIPNDSIYDSVRRMRSYVRGKSIAK